MLLKKLTDACGLPGFEDEVRNLIKEAIGDAATVRLDRMGNLIAVKNENAPGPHIALSAHMDEVGLCVRAIEDNGNIKFASWSADKRVLPSQRVRVGKDKVLGVIGLKPIHLLNGDERHNAANIDNLYIDIGAEKKGDAESAVAPGDFAAFDSAFVAFGDHKIKAKALDDRVGCAAIIEILKSDLPCKLTGIFCVQEEVGLRGSAVAAKSLNAGRFAGGKADLVINIEGTLCADADPDKRQSHVTTLGAGPALSLLDRTSVYLRRYVDDIVAVAERHGIPYQFRRTGASGTDAGNYHTAGEGTPCIGIAVPCRYLHSPVSVMDVRDYENLVKLLTAYCREKGE